MRPLDVAEGSGQTLSQTQSNLQYGNGRIPRQAAAALYRHYDRWPMVERLSEFLEDERELLPIVKAQPREVVTHGAEPDLACIYEDGKQTAFVEAKLLSPEHSSHSEGLSRRPARTSRRRGA